MTYSDDVTKALDFASTQLARYNLADWAVELPEELPSSAYGYADFDTKTISISTMHWPTKWRNIKECILHEISHAMCGHGEHNLQWWDTLIDIGGRGVWVEEYGEPKTIGVVVTY